MVSKINADGTTVATRSVSETGHAKNVSSFADLIKGLTDFGPTYQPSNEQLHLWALGKKQEAVHAAMHTWNIASRDEANAENERTSIFSKLMSYSTRIVNTLSSSANVSSQTIDDARSILNKIQGRRSAQGKKAIDVAKLKGTDEPRTISVSQQSYDQKLAHFATLRILLASQPTYQPNEPDLTLRGVEEYENKLKAANSNMVSARSKLIDARNLRNQQLYDDINGVVALSKAIKSYVKGIYGASHVNFKKINGISFKQYKDKASTLR